MEICKKLKEIDFLLLLKTGLGSAIAIFLANRFNLLYSSSAGIITLLTIQNTKKETIVVAFKRILAFVVAVSVAYIVFTRIGYTPIAFGVFIFIFVAICNILALQDGIAMNAVLVTHFLIEKRIDSLLIMNEVSLLIIGMSLGIILNLIMRNNDDEIKKEQEILDNKIRNLFRCMATLLRGEEKCLQANEKGKGIDFKDIDCLLDDLLLKAYQDAGNTLLSETKYRISYLEMRKLQIVVSKDIFKSIEQIQNIPPQSIEISKYMENVAEQFQESNNVRGLLIELEELYDFFRNEKLPATRIEFENRAILFNILKDIEHFLEIKRTFMKEK